MDLSKNPTGTGGHHENNHDHDESYLAEMIGGVLEDELDNDGRFDRTLLDNTETMLDSRRYDERDYQTHRRESFPDAIPRSYRTHNNSVRTNRSSHRRKSKTSRESIGSPQRSAGNLHSFAHTRVNSNENDREEPSENDPLLLQTEHEKIGFGTPILSPQSSFYDELSSSPVKKVQFEIGGAPVNSSDDGIQLEKKKHHRRHHHHHHHYSKMQQEASPDTRLDREINARFNPLMPESLDLGPEVPMGDLDKDDLQAHRFADNKSYRRHKYQRNFLTEEVSPTKQATKYNHKPHEIFVELDVLSGHGEHREWKETARWIKYEEDVEEGADRWGRPHVASLSFHSLINLRRLIETGVTLLDLEERDLPGVAYRAVEAMVVQELIRPEDRSMIMRALLLKHRHVTENEGWRFNKKNTHSESLTSLHALMEDKNKNKQIMTSNSTVPSGLSKMSRRNSVNTHRIQQDLLSNGQTNEFIGNRGTDEGHHAVVDMSSLSNLSEDDFRWVMNKDSSLLRRIPLDAEASIVLVGKDEKLKRPIMAFIRLAESSYMPNITELPIPVRFLYILLGPSSFDLDYKEIGRSISTLMSNRHFHEIAYKANDRKDMLKGIHEFLDESIVLPPGDWDDELFPFEEMKEKSQMLRKRKEKQQKKVSDANEVKGLLPNGPPGGDDPFKRTGRLFGGMMQDVRKRYPQYPSDIKDGLHFQILASIIFIYFACVSGAIAFGGILVEKTGKHIGISETLVGTAIAGVIFSIFSGQPLVVVGVTGPLLLFDDSLYKICTTFQIEFLAFRFYIGMWVAFIGMIMVAFDMSSIASYFSRFVCEIFASMIAVLFIFDALNSLALVYLEHPLKLVYHNTSISGNDSNKKVPLPNTALLSTVLCLGTFAIAYSFRLFRTSRYFNPMIRDLLGNFAVPIAIVLMVTMDYTLKEATKTEKLNVPDGLKNTKVRNSWIIDPSSISIQLALLAIVPAFLVFILIFMETSICSLIIGKKENKLVKGGGYHLDIFLISIINGGLATIGGCWVCAATVRAVAHASSLTIYSTNNPPGEKPTVLGVREQRVSNFVVAVLVGLSVLMSPALVLIPMSVLFGVFLFMGISSMSGIQFFDRISLLFKQVSNYPQVYYVRRVKTSKMHLFTVIQILCLVILFVVKFTPAALAIPFLLILLVPLRMYLLPCFFTPVELACLDAKGLEPDQKPMPEEPFELPVVTIKEIKENSVPKEEDSETPSAVAVLGSELQKN